MITNCKTKPSKTKEIIVKSRVVLIMFGLGILLSKTIKAQAVEQKPGIFYSITGNGLKDSSYLFGTYHLIKSSYLNETPNVLKAFGKTKGVITEIVIDSTEMAAANSKGLLKEKRLTEFFDKSFADSLDATLKKDLGAGLSQVNALKPMTVMLTMSMVYLMKENQELLSKYVGSALDGHFVEQAKAAGKTIRPLETITEQLDLLFNGTTDEEQATALKNFIRNKEANIKLGNDLLKTYLNNDLEGIQKVYEETLKASGEKDYLVKQRNINWMQVLPGLIKAQSRFIAVGALHLSGADGLVEHLRKLGYTVTALKL